jgi:hypothetical protein
MFFFYKIQFDTVILFALSMLSAWSGLHCVQAEESRQFFPVPDNYESFLYQSRFQFCPAPTLARHQGGGLSGGLIEGEVPSQCPTGYNLQSVSQDVLPQSFSETILRFGNRGRDRIFIDFGNLYQKNNVKNYSLALLGAGILANTKMDRHFQTWYQNQIRCNFTKEFSEFAKIFGEGKIFIPVTVTAAVIYRFRQERFGRVNENNPVGNFFDQTARGYAVGAPTLLTAQIVLGANRPRNGSSYWKPFQHSHGVSGHAYIGAVPFLTAAQMTENIWAKSVFYTLSIIPGWSRVNEDAHYLSQVLLGWYLAYLSVCAVSETEGLEPFSRNLTIFPLSEGNNSVGIGLLYRR